MVRQEAKHKRGRPKKQKVFTVQELQAQSAEYRRKAAEHRVGYQDLDVEDFVEEIDRLTRKRKHTEQEILDIRTKVDLLYHEFVEQKQQEEAEAMAPYAETMRTLAIENDSQTTEMMSKAEWNRQHGLRKNGKGLKPGPQKQKPKSIFDIELKPATNELPDYEWLEQQWFEQQVERMKNEPNFPVGKRLRDDSHLRSQRIKQAKDFWI